MSETTNDNGEQLLCSFCGKSQRQVKKLIAGPGVYICDECIDLCNEIIDEEAVQAPASLEAETLPRPRDRRPRSGGPATRRVGCPPPGAIGAPPGPPRLAPRT